MAPGATPKQQPPAMKITKGNTMGESVVAIDEDHRHKWSPVLHRTGSQTTDVMLVCDCNTATPLSVLIDNTKAAAALQAKIDLLVSQLWKGDLKKEAKERAYGWIMANKPEAIQKKPEQETLLSI